MLVAAYTSQVVRPENRRKPSTREFPRKAASENHSSSTRSARGAVLPEPVTDGSPGGGEGTSETVGRGGVGCVGVAIGPIGVGVGAALAVGAGESDGVGSGVALGDGLGGAVGAGLGFSEGVGLGVEAEAGDGLGFGVGVSFAP